MNETTATLSCVVLAAIGALTLGIALTLLKGGYGPNRWTNGYLWITVGTMTSAAATHITFGHTGMSMFTGAFVAVAAAALWASPRVAYRRALRDGMLAAEDLDRATHGEVVDHFASLITHQGMKAKDAEKQLAERLRMSKSQARILLRFDPERTAH